MLPLWISVIVLYLLSFLSISTWNTVFSWEQKVIMVPVMPVVWFWGTPPGEETPAPCRTQELSVVESSVAGWPLATDWSLCPCLQSHHVPALASWALSRSVIELSGTSCTINTLQDGLRVWIRSVPQTGTWWVGFIMWFWANTTNLQ